MLAFDLTLPTHLKHSNNFAQSILLSEQRSENMPSSSKETTENEDAMKGISEPRDTDVLQGRGGAALRHAGNQTYRKLVDLNKILYTTCLKTEKLKISKSIVAAIREQKGRFLERDAKTGLWFDIGDKKAVEKTSQALREGQAKLRNMLERGQVPTEKASMQHPGLQKYGNGIYNPRDVQGNLNPPDGGMHDNMHALVNDRMNSGMSVSTMSSFGRMASLAASAGSGESGSSFTSMLDSVQKPQVMMGRNNTGQFRNDVAELPPPMRTSSTLSNGTNMHSMGSFTSIGLNNDTTMRQKMSLTDQSIPSWTPSIGSIESLMTISTGGVSHIVNKYNNKDPFYGSHNNNNNSSDNHNFHKMQSSDNNNININDSLSDFGMNGNVGRTDSKDTIEPSLLTEKIGSFDPREQPRQQQQPIQQQPWRHHSIRNGDHAQNGFKESDINNNYMNDQRPIGHNGHSDNDRRRHFAKTKVRRSDSPRSLSSQDDMSDIHMVESQLSLMSMLSRHGSKHPGQNTDMDLSKNGYTKKDSIGSEYIGLGSRRSMMSGISKLSAQSSDIHDAIF